MAAVKDRPLTCRPRQLADLQRKQLIKSLEAGPLAAGFLSKHWALKRVASVIEQELGVHSSLCRQTLASNRLQSAEADTSGTPKE